MDNNPLGEARPSRLARLKAAGFDESVLDGTVDEVNDFIAANPQHADAARAAEARGKGRKGIVEVASADDGSE